MAGKGNLANLKPFKPGQSGNLAGRAGVLPPEIRAERKKNQAAFIKLVSELLLLSASEARDRTKQGSQLELAVQAVITKAKTGDVIAFRYLIETMVGKIPEHDHDGFTEEDLRILNRVKEVLEEQRRAESATPVSSDASGSAS